MRGTNKTQFYDYEGYTVYHVGSYSFIDRGYSTYVHAYPVDYAMLYPIDKERLSEGGSFIVHIEDHPELLNTAKKVYVHSTCTLPREALAKKYKRCLDPLVADAIVIPESTNMVGVWENTAAFVNDENKTIYVSAFSRSAWDNDREKAAFSKISSAVGGTRFLDLVSPISRAEAQDDNPQLCAAKLFYFGPICLFGRKNMHLFDIETFKIPKDKIVYQSTIMNSINDDTNEPTYDAMMSIYDMLNSSEDATVEVGLKSLAALDYAHYPQAVRTILMRSSNWRWSKAKSSTAVKYMLNSMGINSNRCYGYSSRYISEKDYALTEKLIRQIQNLKSEMEYINYCYNIPFVFVDGELNVHPRLL
jgi:hypothetical protein